MSNLSAPFLLLLLLIWATVASASISPQVQWFPASVSLSKQQCSGSIDECISGEEEEFELDSVSNRRILATGNYISYGALQRNTIPCSRRGSSYYNCRPGAPSNPYSRGCSAITRCRG